MMRSGLVIGGGPAGLWGRKCRPEVPLQHVAGNGVDGLWFESTSAPVSLSLQNVRVVPVR